MVEVENVQLEMEEGEWSDNEVADEISEQGNPKTKRGWFFLIWKYIFVTKLSLSFVHNLQTCLATKKWAQN